MSQRPNLFTLNPHHHLANGLVFAGLGAMAGANHYHDSNLYGNHGTLINIDTVADWVNALERRVVRLDGIDDRIAIPSVSFVDTFAISMWLNLNNFTAAQAIFGNTSNTDSDGIFVDITTGKISITIGGANTILSDIGLIAESWQHIIVTRDITTNNMNVYIDGVGVCISYGNPPSTAARASLIADHSWSITDGGQA